MARFEDAVVRAITPTLMVTTTADPVNSFPAVNTSGLSLSVDDEVRIHLQPNWSPPLVTGRRS